MSEEEETKKTTTKTTTKKEEPSTEAESKTKVKAEETEKSGESCPVKMDDVKNHLMKTYTVALPGWGWAVAALFVLIALIA